MKRYAIAAALAACAAVPMTGCGGPGTAPAAVPSLGQSAGGANQGGGVSGGAHAAALHAAAQCIRQHGIPAFQDPVLTPSGQVYVDTRSFQDAPRSTFTAVNLACRTLLTQADLNPEREPPAPPQLVEAGVRSAECLRANGMPKVKDPTARSIYTPGHGFGLTADEVPPGGKRSPVWQHAAQACRPLLDAEIRASTLASLGDDG